MTRLEKWAIGAILYGMTCAGSVNGQAHVAISSTATHQWTLLYREFETEFLLCLYGYARNDSLTVEFAIAADLPPRHSLPSAVAEGGTCLGNEWLTGGLRLVGLAHNHARTRARINGERFQTDPDEDLCYQGGADTVAWAKEGWPIAVVVCGVDRVLVVLRPNRKYECRYDAELETPVLKCERKS